MNIESELKKNEMYNEALGQVKAVLGNVDTYRFGRVREYLVGDSVLDVGCGAAAFLQSIADDYQVTGTEINEVRVNHCNSVLGQDVVKLGNLEETLDFKDDSFDTVTCLEVLEHLENPRKALTELIRVSRKRVIVTVPYNENIQYVLCIHCAKYTPNSGHLHSFNREYIYEITPQNITRREIIYLGSMYLKYFLYISESVIRVPFSMISFIDKSLNQVFSRPRWMMVILEKNAISDTIVSK